MSTSMPFYSIRDPDADRVKNSSGESLGTLHGLMVNTETDSVEYAILSFDGYMGMGDQNFVVPWSAISEDEDFCVLHVEKEQLKTLLALARTVGESWPILNFVSESGTQQAAAY